MRGAMILAAGRGERMRPLSDATPKSLLHVGGKPLIAWQVDALAQAGFRDIVINASWLAEALVAALGDGSALGVRIRWSLEDQPLESAGGIATALPLLPPGPVLIVSGDLWTRFDYEALAERANAMAGDAASSRVHLVMVPNPPFHPAGDFALADGRIALDGSARLTFGNIGLYDTALFRELPRGVKLKLLPLFREWIGRGWVSGERFDGPWANVGTPADLAALDRQLSRPSGAR
ncbi:MAG: N-acetylmuramate alpha-1-phosphate uridylyltransferase MurU [Betaproteobacteria bacterium]